MRAKSRQEAQVPTPGQGRAQAGGFDQCADSCPDPVQIGGAVEAENMTAASGRPGEPEQTAQRGGLAGAVATQQPEHRTARHGQVETFQSESPSAGPPVGLAQPAELDDRVGTRCTDDDRASPGRCCLLVTDGWYGNARAVLGPANREPPDQTEYDRGQEDEHAQISIGRPNEAARRRRSWAPMLAPTIATSSIVSGYNSSPPTISPATASLRT